MNDLGRNIERRMQEQGISAAKLADLVKTSRATISHIINGKSKKSTLLPDIAKALNTTVEELLKPASNVGGIGKIEAWDSRTPLELDEVELPLFREVALSAGIGSTEVIENHGAKLRFARSTLSRNGIMPEHAACCYVNGDSMEPVLPSGSTVAIDTANKLIVDGKMYAIDQGGMLRVKYLYRIPSGGIRIRSANREEYPDEEVYPQSEEEFRILGRVFWYGVLLT